MARVPRRHERLQLPALEGRLLPARGEAAALARVLRRALRRGRAQRHLLQPAEARDVRGAGASARPTTSASSSRAAASSRTTTASTTSTRRSRRSSTHASALGRQARGRAVAAAAEDAPPTPRGSTRSARLVRARVDRSATRSSSATPAWFAPETYARAAPPPLRAVHRRLAHPQDARRDHRPLHVPALPRRQRPLRLRLLGRGTRAVGGRGARLARARERTSTRSSTTTRTGTPSTTRGASPNSYGE